MAEKPPVIGMLSVRKAWIDSTGFEKLFTSMFPERKAEIYVFPIAKYGISHPAFVEIEWYPRAMNGEPARLFIPSHEVIALAILGPEAGEKINEIGFKP
jgi:hypothetical protein